MSSNPRSASALAAIREQAEQLATWCVDYQPEMYGPTVPGRAGSDGRPICVKCEKSLTAHLLRALVDASGPVASPQDSELLKGWRQWAQFVFLGGDSLVTTDDAELRRLVSVEIDKDVATLRAERDALRAQLKSLAADSVRNAVASGKYAEAAEARLRTLLVDIDKLKRHPIDASHVRVPFSGEEGTVFVVRANELDAIVAPVAPPAVPEKTPTIDGPPEGSTS